MLGSLFALLRSPLPRQLLAHWSAINADSDSQTTVIAPDTLPRPPENDCDLATLRAEALESLVMIFGDVAPEDLPPSARAALENLLVSLDPDH